MIARQLVGGKSGQHRTRQLLTATGGDPRESATETKPPKAPHRGEVRGARRGNKE